MSSCETIPSDVGLDEALASVEEDRDFLTYEIVSDSRGRLLPFAAELEDVVEAALEKTFISIQSFAQ